MIANPFLAKYPDHALFRALTLMERGRRLVDSDAVVAEGMLREVMRLDPSNAMAANLVLWIEGKM